MRMQLLAAGCLAAALTASAPAGATLLDWSYAGASYSGSGTLTADSSGDVTAITGTFNGAIVTGLGSWGQPSNTISYPNQPYLDGNGLSFDTNDGNAWNIYNFLPSYYTASPYSGPSDYFGSFTLAAPAPELSTWAMLGLGFAGLAFAGHRSRRSATQTA
ncbi:hypothetical protein DFR50_13264 [Roseiarcus fermentans]|uniref:Secreted protein with PEP-CTERM sorting signal n=1 Tax=Roseiarcus fermentans TaxID=1473586 RepID=A0A366EWJ8_9HYPH|nr:hypothetical protein [Roseiarcus fermentans]RBP06286.1 hypothetical protein DFR50_13264 [Roseiarcus fermentans]